MKKSETIIRPLGLEEIRFQVKQLRRDLFSDMFVTAVMNCQPEKYQTCHQFVYINQHRGREYSFPPVSFGKRTCCYTN
jgi:ribosomal protein L29